jgi:hypothetical protein
MLFQGLEEKQLLLGGPGDLKERKIEFVGNEVLRGKLVAVGETAAAVVFVLDHDFAGERDVPLAAVALHLARRVEYILSQGDLRLTGTDR